MEVDWLCVRGWVRMCGVGFVDGVVDLVKGW